MTAHRVALGPNSPLLTKGGRARVVRLTEFPIQAGIVEALVGKIGKGPRVLGSGITGRYPELLLLYAIPNGAVARGPFIGLYLEIKRPGTKSARPSQRARADQLRAEGHCVLTIDDTQRGVDAVLRYLKLGPLWAMQTDEAQAREALFVATGSYEP
jgi:hypothetical protein